MGWIIPIQGDWELSGDVLYRDLEVGVTEYDLPFKVVRIIKAEVMYVTGGSFVPVHFRDLKRDQNTIEGNTTRIEDDVNRPVADLMGDLISLRPAPTTTVVNGFAIWVQQDFTNLEDDADGVNDVPDIMEPAIRAIAVGAALDYAVAEEMDKKEIALKRMLFGDPRVPDDKGLKGVIEDLYANRSAARRNQLTAKKQSYK